MKKESIYLLAFYSMRPKPRVKTQLKGWMEDASNVQYDEQVALSRRLKNSDLTSAKIILDMSNKKVVKNGWNSGNSFDELFVYFSKGYPRYTYEVMNQLDPDYVTKFMTKIGDTPEEAVDALKEFDQEGFVQPPTTEEVVIDTPYRP